MCVTIAYSIVYTCRGIYCPTAADILTCVYIYIHSICNMYTVAVINLIRTFHSILHIVLFWRVCVKYSRSLMKKSFLPICGKFYFHEL